jgi:hypothetical protein
MFNADSRQLMRGLKKKNHTSKIGNSKGLYGGKCMHGAINIETTFYINSNFSSYIGYSFFN